ncbi:hypothetical protein VTO73DRAFT_2410 [Trametes versicolor]
MAPLSSAGPPLAHCPSFALAVLAMPLPTESLIELTSELKRSPSSGARAATHPSRSECAGVRDPKWLIRAEAFIDAGGHMSLMASESITQDDKRERYSPQNHASQSNRHFHVVIWSSRHFRAFGYIGSGSYEHEDPPTSFRISRGVFHASALDIPVSALFVLLPK